MGENELNIVAALKTVKKHISRALNDYQDISEIPKRL